MRRDIADLILEALDVARSRRLAAAETTAYVLDILRIERPDLHPAQATLLVDRFRRRHGA